MDQKEWTIMIYMAGDNNLAVDMAYALKQIQEASGHSPNSPNVFVYYDGNSPSIPTLYCDFSDSKYPRYQTSSSVSNKLYPANNNENENAADMRSVYNFIDWCVNKVEVVDGTKVSNGRPAKRYALILAGHSLGFHDIGLFRDEGSGKAMKMEDLKKAFERIVADKKALRAQPGFDGFGKEKKAREETVLLGQKLDILGFDSCVMGMLEVGYQFTGIADVMIASEGSVPNAGWTYANILDGRISKLNGKSTGPAVAEEFVREFINGQNAFTIGGVSVDIAALDLSKLNDLARAFDDLSQKLVECFKNEDSYVYRCMERSILQVHWKSQSYMYDQNVDLGDFCELLERECGFIIDDLDHKDTKIFSEVRASCKTVLGRLKDTVILSGISGGTYQYSNGISVFFPWSLEGYTASERNYDSLWIAKRGGSGKFSWRTFLKEYLEKVSRRTEPVVSTGKFWYHLPDVFGELSNKTSEPHDRLGGQQSTRIPSLPDVRLPGYPTTRIAGQQTTRIAGQQTTRIAGQQTTRIAGQQTTRIAGQQTTRIAGQQTTRLAGQSTTRLADLGSNQFFDFLRLFKNVESPWNVTGFTKEPNEKGIGKGG